MLRASVDAAAPGESIPKRFHELLTQQPRKLLQVDPRLKVKHRQEDDDSGDHTCSDDEDDDDADDGQLTMLDFFVGTSGVMTPLFDASILSAGTLS